MADIEPDDPMAPADAEQALSDDELGNAAGGKLPGEPPPRK